MADINEVKTLSELRELRGLTQKQLAELSDYDIGKIEEFEKGTAKPKGSGCLRIADALKVDVFTINNLLGL
ncbi:helix-turn-helix transcriptional regulator [Acinetobacter radioresistens]|uniref:helix-turn-helix domain-containing protein n=1 Tax=Acinetobacter radioresistens TaxID=40216 RepID=UPI0002F0A049|nr:helix-turn-helix transcriptional regulator [Acinetobacter radioresistens]MCU4623896.1 helix-turn-helix transcriptional regulator [Acinetobacter radioresistens]